MSKVHVLIVDDDVKLLQLLRMQLQFEGLYVVDSAEGGQEAINLVEKHQPDVVVLDLSMPDMDGFEVCRKIRQLSGDLGATWIIVLSALPAKTHTEAALKAGADAYMEKPLDLGVFSGYIHNALRRMARPQLSTQNPLEFGSLRIDAAQRKVYLDDQEVHLTKTQYRVLELLASNAGNLVPSEMILSKIWGARGETIPDTARLRTCIRDLRRVLKDEADSPHYIMTKVGMGYQFCSPSKRAQG